jgi:hypothetical protein
LFGNIENNVIFIYPQDIQLIFFIFVLKKAAAEVAALVARILALNCLNFSSVFENEGNLF